MSHHPTVEARDTTARTSLRLLAVLNVQFKYACARPAARHVVRKAGYIHAVSSRARRCTSFSRAAMDRSGGRSRGFLPVPSNTSVRFHLA